MWFPRLGDTRPWSFHLDHWTCTSGALGLQIRSPEAMGWSTQRHSAWQAQPSLPAFLLRSQTPKRNSDPPDQLIGQLTATATVWPLNRRISQASEFLTHKVVRYKINIKKVNSLVMSPWTLKLKLKFHLQLFKKKKYLNIKTKHIQDLYDENYETQEKIQRWSK